MKWFRSDRCEETTKEYDGKWRCGKKAGHPGTHQAMKRGTWYAIWWAESDEELDRHFGISHET